MAIQTSDGQVYADSTEFLKASIYDPNHAEHSQPDLNSLFFQAADQTDVPTGDPYSTQLTPDQQQQFQIWKSKNAPNDPGSDYDLQGAFKAGLTPAENGHFPDTYKKPNHMTFSTESQYSTPNNPGGTWSENPDKTWTFTASPLNLKYHSPQELKDYFNQYEKGNTLILPTNK